MRKCLRMRWGKWPVRLLLSSCRIIPLHQRRIATRLSRKKETTVRTGTELKVDKQMMQRQPRLGVLESPLTDLRTLHADKPTLH